MIFELVLEQKKKLSVANTLTRIRSDYNRFFTDTKFENMYIEDISRKDIEDIPHSFRRNAITYVTNATNGNIIMAASLFGNTPDVSSKNYYLGADLEPSKSIS